MSWCYRYLAISWSIIRLSRFYLKRNLLRLDLTFKDYDYARIVSEVMLEIDFFKEASCVLDHSTDIIYAGALNGKVATGSHDVHSPALQ